MTSNNPAENDYYQILGVLRTAKLTDITAAFQVLARECHPDVRAADPDSLARFKLLNEAYEVLSDAGKRRAYDRRLHQLRGRTSVDWSTFGALAAESLPPWIEAVPRPCPAAENDIEVSLPIAPEEALHGGPCQFTLEVSHECRRCEGRGILVERRCNVCRGEGRIREKRSLQITIPRGARTGTLIRIAGYGKRSQKSTGDLWVRLRIQPSW